MKKILLIGNCPLPNEECKCRPAAGLRTYQFLKPVLNAGYTVKLVCIAMPDCYDDQVSYKEEKISGKFSKITISKNDPKILSRIQLIHDAFSPDVIVGVNTHPSYIASRLNFKAPFWADLNGWIMAEAQAQAYKSESNAYLPHYYEMEESIIKKADHFSAVSDKERCALIGELSCGGRLNKDTFGFNFVSHIPNGIEWFEGEKENMDKNSDILKDIPQDAFILLWMGGYNTWVDEETLFKALDLCMENCPNLYFVSTGGEIEGLDNRTFANFKKMISESPHKKRYKFLGWVLSDDIPYLYKRANAGINVDRICCETCTGARNRINEMMKFGLPVISTLGSEISYEMEKSEAGIGVKSGDFMELHQKIQYLYLECMDETDVCKNYGGNGKKYIREHCNYEVLQENFIKWLENPVKAPDRGTILDLQRKSVMSGGLKYLKDNGIVKFLKKAWQKIRG